MWHLFEFILVHFSSVIIASALSLSKWDTLSLSYMPTQYKCTYILYPRFLYLHIHINIYILSMFAYIISIYIYIHSMYPYIISMYINIVSIYIYIVSMYTYILSLSLSLSLCLIDSFECENILGTTNSIRFLWETFWCWSSIPNLSQPFVILIEFIETIHKRRPT